MTPFHPTRKPLAILLSATLLAGCAPQAKILIDATPGVAEVYVDGEAKGRTPATVEVGPEHDYQRTLDVAFKRDGQPLTKVSITSELDGPEAALEATIWGIALAVNAASAAFSRNQTLLTMNLIGAVVSAIGIPLAFMRNHKFRKAYAFDLQHPASVPARP